jgi:hypothetical protein
MNEDDYVLIFHRDVQDELMESRPKYLNDVDDFIENISGELWTINRKIHDNPELGYKERKAHALLTGFLKSKGWKVTASAYGMDTAWVAVYDSGKKGPVVSLNVEMGAPVVVVPTVLSPLTKLEQMPCPAWATRADTTSLPPRHWPPVWQQPK